MNQRSVTTDLIRGSRSWTRARQRWYRLLEVSPAAFCTWNRRFPERTVVERGTDLVIEGYPSAANSLVREVLYRTTPGIRIASHIHSPAHVARAIQLGVPVLVLLRPPVDSVASLMARYPERELRPAEELRRYRAFYRSTRKMTDDVVLARFEDTVSSLGSVIRMINDRFATSFAAFDDADGTFFEEVFATLDYWSARVSGSDRFEVVTPRPSEARREALTETRRQVERSGGRRLEQCRQLHDQLAAIAEARQEAWAGGSPAPSAEPGPVPPISAPSRPRDGGPPVRAPG